MAQFQYQAVDRDGRLISGALEADSVEHASGLLQARGLTAHAITREFPETPSGPDDVSAPKTPAIVRPASSTDSASGQNLEEAVLRSHMAAILERGRPIVPALRAYAAEMPGGWKRRQLQAVCRVLERGDPDEATKALVALPETWIPLLSAATTAPDPGQVLHEFLNESRRTDTLRQQWWLTLAYPIIMLCLATAVTTALALFVIPEFDLIFAEFDLRLPAITMWMLDIYGFLWHWGMLILAALLLLLLVTVLHANRWLPQSAFSWLTNRLRLPFGRRTSIARFSRFTADLLEGGVNMPDALRIAGFTVNRLRIRQAAWRLANDIQLTGGFTPGAYQRPLTASVAGALAADVPPKSRVRLLREISNSHADRTRINLSWASGIIEPVAIFVVGILVGLTVIGLFLPLVMLVEGLSK